MELFRELLLTTVLCGVAAFILGFLWYHPKVLGEKWRIARNKDAEDRRKVLSTLPFSLSFMLWLMAGFFYSFIAMTFEITAFHDLIAMSCLLWVGFAMPPIVMGSFYTGYPVKAAAIESAYQLGAYYTFAMVYFLTATYL